MGQKYEQLKQEDRERIFVLFSSGKSQKEIAVIVGRNKSTISRELQRGGIVSHRKGLQYFASQAQRRAEERKKKSRKVAYVRKNPILQRRIEDSIHQGWSPEQIAGFLKYRDKSLYLNPESIYQYIYSREGVQKRLGYYLRTSRLIRCWKGSRRPKHFSIADRVEISQRPLEVQNRDEFGHWEGDTMLFMGHRQQLATHVERKSRYIIAARVKDMKAATRTEAIEEQFAQFPPGTTKTFTFDNGPEFAEHKKLKELLGANAYFTEPYKAWQKGSIENANGLIRWYFPRMTDVNKLEDWKLRGVLELINHRPRKCLNFRSAAEVFAEELGKLPPSVALQP